MEAACGSKATIFPVYQKLIETVVSASDVITVKTGIQKALKSLDSGSRCPGL
jgi:hypothetical protein